MTNTSLPEHEAEELLTVCPTQRETARILGVSESTLSRRRDIESVPVGERERRYPIASVLSLAAIYKKRTLNQVAGALLEYANEVNAELRPRVQDEIDRFFEGRVPALDPRRFLEEAKRTLPRHLYERVRDTYEQGVPEATQLTSAPREAQPKDTLTGAN